ncbi:BZIP domain-containing protein [Mycena indigotica]|uniref:BZIP domain-containing protein n=1 Tax=Mycena indigotica TaxID=2126181 RepID=A0A8H6T3I2_9AGAR|nr:BZIP domain-containing protein [Mycena indigotica]KAF7310328.1 BZIP domain-containing protein [Mycena indigotica]
MSTVSSSSRVSTASAASSLGWRAHEGPSCTAFHDSDEDNTAHSQSLTTSPQTLHGLIGAASDSSHGSVPSFSALTDYSPVSSTMAEQHQALRAIADITASPEFQSVCDNFAADFDAYADQPLFDDYDYEYSPEPELGHDVYDSPSPHDTPYTPFLTTPRLAMEADFGAAYTVEENELAGQLSALPDDSDASEAGPVNEKLSAPPNLDKLLVFSPSSPMLHSFNTAPIMPPPPQAAYTVEENELAGQLLALPDDYSRGGSQQRKAVRAS